jgi:hypothetical protein
MTAGTVETAHEVVDALSNGTSISPLDPLKRIDAGLAVLKAEAKPFDVATTEGNRAARAFRLKCVSLRTSVDDAYEFVNRPLLIYQRDARALRDKIKSGVLELEQPVDQAIKADEAKKEAERQAKLDAERARVDRLGERIDEIKGVAARAVGKPAAEVLAKIQLLTGMAIGPSFQEFQQAAERARDVALATLRELHTAVVAQEAEAARLAAERADLDRRQAEQAEQAEAARIDSLRVAKHRAGIAVLQSFVAAAHGKTAEQIRSDIGILQGLSFGDEWDEFAAEAAQARGTAVKALAELHTIARERESEAVRIEAQRLEQARVAAEQAERQRQLDEQDAAIKRRADELYARLQDAQSSKAHEDAFARAVTIGQGVIRSIATDEELLGAEPFGQTIARGTANDDEWRGIVTVSSEVRFIESPALTDPEIVQLAKEVAPTLKVGDMNQRLGFLLTRDFVETKLGFPAITTRGRHWGLWNERDWPLICKTLADHVLAAGNTAPLKKEAP